MADLHRGRSLNHSSLSQLEGKRRARCCSMVSLIGIRRGHLSTPNNGISGSLSFLPSDYNERQSIPTAHLTPCCGLDFPTTNTANFPFPFLLLQWKELRIFNSPVIQLLLCWKTKLEIPFSSGLYFSIRRASRKKYSALLTCKRRISLQRSTCYN